MIDVVVNFNQSVYYINEQDGSVSLTVFLTEPLNSTNVTVYIGDESGDSISSNGKCVLDIINVILQNCFAMTDNSSLLNITVPAQQISVTKSVSISSTTDNHLPLFTIMKLCLSATGPNDHDKTCSNDSVTGPDGPNATNITVTIGEDKQTTVGKLST